METWYQRMIAARQARGLTKTGFAKLVGVSQPTVTDWENGKMQPNGVNLLNASRVLGMSPEQLMTGRASPQKDAAVLARPTKQSEARKVWVVGNGQGGMPDRIWTDGDYPVGASDRYAEEHTNDAHAFIIKLHGDSMVPRYMPGEYVLIEPSIPPDLEDDVLVRLATGETMVKRLLSRRGGIRLGSYSTPEVMTFSDSEITWMYYISNRVPPHKIKHWIESAEYVGEERRHEHSEPTLEERLEPPKMPATAKVIGEASTKPPARRRKAS